ncbi:hypothetical protein HS125_16125 [bacterium]|nr:hypothetical protein [bacterium]
MSFSSLFLSFLVSLVGLAYTVYGRKSGDVLFLGFGVALMVAPYFSANPVFILGLGVVLSGAPFAIRRWG